MKGECDNATRGAPAAIADRACLNIQGPDESGAITRIPELIMRLGGTISALDQYSDVAQGGAFAQRVVFHRPGSVSIRTEVEAELPELFPDAGFEWTVADQATPKRMAILASTSDHCLLDLLGRHRRGELQVTIPLVISNHSDVADDVRSFGIPFHHVPSRGEDKSVAEARILDLLAGNVDFIVLARYMQILSEDLITRLQVPVINIHHSFLPAFIGAGPYRKAKERGVKLIGATAHYVTKDLDEGPIIEQDVFRVTHAQHVADLQRRGADVEREVLSRAVAWHSEDRIIRCGNSTIVFP